MGVMEIILGILFLLLAIVLIAAIVFQEGHDAGLGAIAGNVENFFGGSKGRSYDEILTRWTKIGGIIFAALIILVNIISFFM